MAKPKRQAKRRSKKAKGKRRVQMQLITLNPDPNRWKPFNPRYEPREALYVEFDVPVDEVLVDSDEGLVITPDGLAHLLEGMSAAILYVDVTGTDK